MASLANADADADADAVTMESRLDVVEGAVVMVVNVLAELEESVVIAAIAVLMTDTVEVPITGKERCLVVENVISSSVVDPVDVVLATHGFRVMNGMLEVGVMGSENLSISNVVVASIVVKQPGCLWAMSQTNSSRSVLMSSISGSMCCSGCLLSSVFEPELAGKMSKMRIGFCNFSSDSV